MTCFAFAMPGPQELLIIAIIVVVLFGANRLPQLARAAGQAIPSFKKGVREVEKEIKDVEKELKTIEKDINAS